MRKHPLSISYNKFHTHFAERSTPMYESPKAERLIPESEDVLKLYLLLASNENDETDNEESIDDLLDGLL